MDEQKTTKEPRSPASARFQFALWQLMAAVAFICLVFSFLPWWGAIPVLLVCGVIALGVWLRSRRVILSAIPITVVVLLLAMVMLGLPRTPNKSTICRNSLKTLALSLENYHDAYGCFPPAYVADENGKPMHSWRVLILPFLGCGDLYQKYRFDEPWNGPNNSKLAKHMPWLYRCPCQETKSSPVTTNYVAVTGPGTMWPGQKTICVRDVTDGTCDTLILVESANCGIHWMEPRDLDLATMPLKINPSSAPGISGGHPGGAQAALADGSVKLLYDSLPPDAIKALVERNDGKPIPPWH